VPDDEPKRLRRTLRARLGGLRIERGPGGDVPAGPEIAIWSFGILAGTEVRRIEGV
jgi:hypothetical protein